MRVEDFKREKGETTWYYSPDGDFEFIVEGTETKPNEQSFALARSLARISHEALTKNGELCLNFN